MSEAAITKQIMDWLRKQPDVFAWKAVGSTFSRRGIPDICGSVGSSALWLEVKTEKGKVSPSQRVVHAEILRSGSLVWIVRSLDDAKKAVGTLREIAARAAN